MELSVIIVSYNVRYFLELCLRSVKKASENVDCEIIVVDNDSADDSCHMVTSLFPEVTLIKNKVNEGFSVAINQAISIASGSYTLLLNPDTVVEEDAFRRCLSFMNSHPDAGALGVKMIDGGGTFLPESKRAIPRPKTSFFKIFGLSRLFPRSPFFNYYNFAHLDNSQTGKVEVISGAFMMIRKSALDKTGYLDEDYFMYGEDIDLSFRLIKAGYNNYYFPETRIVHYKGESTDKSNLKYLFNFYSAMLVFISKHYRKSSMPLLFVLVKLAIWLKAFLAIAKRLFIIILDPVRKTFNILLTAPHWGSIKNPLSRPRRTVITGDKNSYTAVLKLLEECRADNLVLGRISPDHESGFPEILGNISDINELIKKNHIDEVIFTTGGLTISEIIDLMHTVSGTHAGIKIAPPGESFVIGSNSINGHGEIYTAGIKKS